MPWTPFGITENNLRRLNSYLSMVGRAIYLCSAFQKKLEFVYTIVDMTVHGQEGGDLRIVSTPEGWKPQRIAMGKVTGRMKKLRVSEEHINAIDKGVEARNWIAHESGLIALSSHVFLDDFASLRSCLLDNVRLLAEADDIVSGYVFSVQEKEPHLTQGDPYITSMLDFVLKGPSKIIPREKTEIEQLIDEALKRSTTMAQRSDGFHFEKVSKSETVHKERSRRKR